MPTKLRDHPGSDFSPPQLKSYKSGPERLPRPLAETGPCNHLAPFGKPEKIKVRKQLDHQNT